ncbi:MAG TPA: SH3 domain-containing protein [Anaerolineales bacterium]|nr:SH3 domain-containing protein [Anaerolineales bacterium]
MKTTMHTHRPRWIQPTVALLLAMALSACTRSASSGVTTMTPLPSAPPPTPTDILPTQTTDPLVTATASETASATEPTKRPTATKAQPTGAAAATLESTAAVCEGAPPTRLSVGLFAYVNPEPPLPNNLRSNPGEDNELTGYIEPGQAMKILEGPECADGWLWWKVLTLETDLTGWTAEGDAQSYWLVPCTSQEQCEP